MTDRREFLKLLGAGSAAAAGLTACGGGGGGASSGPASGGGGGTPPSPLPANPILVLITFEGGLDLLDTMVPVGGANAGLYTQHRPKLKVDPSKTQSLGSNLGLNQAFLGMGALAQQGRVAWMPGIGMPNPTLSHFLAMDLWGQGSASPNGTGWLGRWADRAFAPGGDALRGIATDGLPLALQGAERSFVSISDPGTYRYPAARSPWGSVEDPDPLRAAFADAFALTGTPTGSGLKGAAASGKLYYDAQGLFASLMGGERRTPSVPYPGMRAYPEADLREGYFYLAEQLRFVAEMIAKDLPCQVYAVTMGGFDTHSNHARDFPKLLREAGGALDSFYRDLASITTSKGPAQDRVLVMGHSEFGRRVHENNGGTDHGTAGLAFLLGKSVKGGLYSDYPDLSKLDENGNLRHTVDFRSLYATVLDKWLGADSRGILGAAYPALGALG